MSDYDVQQHNDEPDYMGKRLIRKYRCCDCIPPLQDTMSKEWDEAVANLVNTLYINLVNTFASPLIAACYVRLLTKRETNGHSNKDMLPYIAIHYNKSLSILIFVAIMIAVETDGRTHGANEDGCKPNSHHARLLNKGNIGSIDTAASLWAAILDNGLKPDIVLATGIMPSVITWSILVQAYVHVSFLDTIHFG
ncbi:hypothetical protein ACJX0J_035834 [Zea mays]